VLQFAGAPVRGSVGIESKFAGGALELYQDIVAKVLATRENKSLAQRGMVPGRDAATMHLTNVIHGSFGFVLEELDDSGQASFVESPLKAAADEAAHLVSSFADTDEESFATALVNTDRRVFDTVGTFFKFMQTSGAEFRLISGRLDKSISTSTVLAAVHRAQLTHIEEIEKEDVGQLWILPESHRFEFVSATGRTITGDVTADLSGAELAALNQQLVGHRCRIEILVRQVIRQGAESRDRFKLLSAQRDG